MYVMPLTCLKRSEKRIYTLVCYVSDTRKRPKLSFTNLNVPLPNRIRYMLAAPVRSVLGINCNSNELCSGTLYSTHHTHTAFSSCYLTVPKTYITDINYVNETIVMWPLESPPQVSDTEEHCNLCTVQRNPSSLWSFYTIHIDSKATQYTDYRPPWSKQLW